MNYTVNLRMNSVPYHTLLTRDSRLRPFSYLSFIIKLKMNQVQPVSIAPLTSNNALIIVTTMNRIRLFHELKPQFVFRMLVLRR